MKKLFLSLVALMSATMSFAQYSLVATLSHGETVSMFYGTYALRDAMNAAASGDVINLSGGAFNAVNITKAVTLRGTGIDDTTPTYITGNFTINIPTSDTNRLSMEGIRCTDDISMKGTFNSPYFVKSQFKSFDYSTGNAAANIMNAMFANCKITNNYSMGNTSSVQFINSYVAGFHNYSENIATASFINCVILPWGDENPNGEYPEDITSSQLLNCIIYQNGSNSNWDYPLPSSTVATNCVSIGYTGFFNDLVVSTNNKEVNWNEFAKVFKNFTGNYSDSQTFELAESAKTAYLSTDGTQVGMYGGVLPYDSTPSFPQITKMNVAKKTTADGKLSVEIEVSAAE